MTITMFCVAQTPFTPDLRIDEAALRAHLERLVEAGNGVYIGSPGAAEGYALSVPEYREIFDIAVDAIGGRVPVHCNPREAHSAREMLEVAQEAVAAGIDVVQLYQLNGGHGMTPSVREQDAYWTELLDAIQHPVAISLYGHSPYSASVPAVASLCERYPNIVAINFMTGPNTNSVFTQLRDTLPERVALHTNHNNLVHLFTLGAVGALGVENNVIPNICRSIADGYLAGDLDKVGSATRMLVRFNAILSRATEGFGSPKTIKLALRALGLGNGVVRLPYLAATPEEVASTRAAFDEIGLWSMEESLRLQPSPRG